jgi:seryl-tRNA synthetase
LQDNNAIVREFGSPRAAGDGEKLYNHVDLVTLLDIVNLEAGAAVAGAQLAVRAWQLGFV